MALAFAALLAVFAVAIVLIPFFRSSKKADPFTPHDTESLRSQREAIYKALETLRLERALGQVDEGEYQRQLQEYRRQAAVTLRQQERVEGDQDELDALLEQEVLAARAKLQEQDTPPEGEAL